MFSRRHLQICSSLSEELPAHRRTIHDNSSPDEERGTNRRLCPNGLGSQIQTVYLACNVSMYFVRLEARNWTLPSCPPLML